MKTLFKVLLPLLLTLPSQVRAQFAFTTNNGTITITQYTGPGGAVIIPDATNGYPVTTIGGHGNVPFYQGAFQSCTSLTSLTIGTNVTTIGTKAFSSCTNLNSLTIGSNVTTIGTNAFYGCTSLTSLTISNSVITIALQAFDNCIGLTNVMIGNSVTSIGDMAFYNCTRVTSLTIGTNVTSVGYQTFYECYDLNYLTLPSSLTNIGNYAFEYCNNLYGVFFQGNAPSVGSSAFLYDNSATVYYLAGTTNWLSLLAGRPTLLWDPQVPYHYTTNNGSITITGYIAGYNNSGVPAVMTIPGTINGLPVTSIAAHAFQYLPTLTSTIIPNGVSSIGSYAFQSCSSLARLTFPTSMTNIASWAFFQCTNLHGLYFQSNAPSADSTAFIGDNEATVYYLPATTGWGPMLGTCPTAVWQPQVQTSDGSFGVQSNQFGFNITWANGMTVVVEASTDLGNPTWYPLATNTLSGGSSYFSDPQWTNYPTRFYRIRSP